MARSRKTVNVADLLKKGNHFLAYTRDEDVDRRLGLACMLEAVLHDSGNYKGYRYIDQADRLRGNVPGSGYLSVGIKQGEVQDESRRQYYGNPEGVRNV